MKDTNDWNKAKKCRTDTRKTREGGSETGNIKRRKEKQN
jgi:hypothetical protein